MLSATEECREPSGKSQGISHCLESGHPEWYEPFLQVGRLDRALILVGFYAAVVETHTGDGCDGEPTICCVYHQR